MARKETEQVKNQVQISDNKTTQGSNSSTNAEEKKTNKLQIFFDIIQALGAIATVMAALLAYGTLREMQTERDNAYKPEIVISPNAFEGGRLDEEGPKTNKRHIYINYNTSDPGSCYSEKPSDDADYLFLEIPYLTLKNIGHGTAKDVQVSFSTEWLENAATALDSIIDDYHYEIKTVKGRDGRQMYLLNYSDSDESKSTYLYTDEDVIKKYTYIASDDSSVNVALPQGWVKMLAIIYGRECWESLIRTDPGGAGDLKANIPDLAITIQYTDMQGKPFDEPETIPWTAYYQYVISGESKERKPESIHLQTGFYEDYIR